MSKKNVPNPYFVLIVSGDGQLLECHAHHLLESARGLMEKAEGLVGAILEIPHEVVAIESDDFQVKTRGSSSQCILRCKIIHGLSEAIAFLEEFTTPSFASQRNFLKALSKAYDALPEYTWK